MACRMWTGCDLPDSVVFLGAGLYVAQPLGAMTLAALSFASLSDLEDFSLGLQTELQYEVGRKLF